MTSKLNKPFALENTHTHRQTPVHSIKYSKCLIVGAETYDHVILIKIDLHCLPMEEIIIVTILIIVYKTLNNQGPSYLRDMLSWYASLQTLRLASSMQFGGA